MRHGRSVGGHVRDAAAYFCWAFARAYSSPPQKATGALLKALIVVSCYDREISCRRAAAAALQECVGRWSAVPCGIEVLAVADYFTLSTRQQVVIKFCSC